MFKLLIPTKARYEEFLYRQKSKDISDVGQPESYPVIIVFQTKYTQTEEIPYLEVEFVYPADFNKE